MLPEEDSNLHYLVQSQASYQLDDQGRGDTSVTGGHEVPPGGAGRLVVAQGRVANRRIHHHPGASSAREASVQGQQPEVATELGHSILDPEHYPGSRFCCRWVDPEKVWCHLLQEEVHPYHLQRFLDKFCSVGVEVHRFSPAQVGARGLNCRTMPASCGVRSPLRWLHGSHEATVLVQVFLPPLEVGTMWSTVTPRPPQ